MKRIFGFFSVVLLLIVCLANAPPLKFELPVDDEQDFVITYEADQVIAVPVTDQFTDITLPLVFGAISFPEVTLTVKDGMLGMDYDGTSYYAIQDVTVWNLNSIVEAQLYRSYENRLHLAKIKTRITELSRLDIGELISIS